MLLGAIPVLSKAWLTTQPPDRK